MGKMVTYHHHHNHNYMKEEAPDHALCGDLALEEATNLS